MNLDDYKLKFKTERADQTLVNRILEVSGQDKSKYTFWLKKVHESKRSMNEVLDLCDKAETLDEKYNRGGFIRNRL